MASHAWRTGPKSSSSDWKSAAAAARWSSQAPNWPRRASLARSAMWAQLSNGVSSSHFSRWAETSSESAGSVLTRCSSMAAWQDPKRRRCAVSQLLKSGLRSISSPSRKSPTNRLESACSRCGSSVSMPAAAADATSSTSTEMPSRSSAIVSPAVSILRRSGSSRAAAQFAQAPAKLASGIIWNIPQQFAELATSDRMGRQCQIGQQRAQFARCRQSHRDAVAHNRQRPEKPQGKAFLAACLARFHACFHACSHAGPPAIALSPNPTKCTGSQICAPNVVFTTLRHVKDL